MNKRSSNVGTEINELDLAVVKGGSIDNTIATEGDYAIKVDPKPLWETAKSVWKEITSWF
jgi:hypothetical protein